MVPAEAIDTLKRVAADSQSNPKVVVNLTCNNQPGVPCDILRRLERSSFAVATPLNFALDESVRITLDLGVRTPEAKTLQITGIAAAPTGWQ